jgi:predicted lipoprotein with Yx(FWY)xxD motif
MIRRLLLVPLLLTLAFAPQLVVAVQDEEEEVAASVGWAEDPELGIYLTDLDGMALYVFDRDDRGSDRSACAADCAANWPPFTAEEPLALPEGVPGALTLITRDDGTTQVAYNGQPLYYWQGDAAPGDITGHGVGNTWRIASVEADGAAGASPVASPMAMGENEVAVELGEFYVKASTVTLQAGQEYTFVVTNAGVLIHELVIEPAGAVDEPFEKGDMESEIEDIEPGETDTLTWTFDEPGTYQLSCHIPGHFESGMVVEITVEG